MESYATASRETTEEPSVGTWARDVPLAMAALVLGYLMETYIYSHSWWPSPTTAKIEWTAGVPLNADLVNHHIVASMFDAISVLVVTLLFSVLVAPKIRHNAGYATIAVCIGLTLAEIVSFYFER